MYLPLMHRRWHHAGLCADGEHKGKKKRERNKKRKAKSEKTHETHGGPTTTAGGGNCLLSRLLQSQVFGGCEPWRLLSPCSGRSRCVIACMESIEKGRNKRERKTVITSLSTPRRIDLTCARTHTHTHTAPGGHRLPHRTHRGQTRGPPSPHATVVSVSACTASIC